MLIVTLPFLVTFVFDLYFSEVKPLINLPKFNINRPSYPTL